MDVCIYLLQPFCVDIVEAFRSHNGEAGEENVLGIKFYQLEPTSIFSPYLDKIVVAICHSLPESKKLGTKCLLDFITISNRPRHLSRRIPKTKSDSALRSVVIDLILRYYDIISQV